MITQESVNKLLRYDSETGILYWRVNRGGKAIAGARAGYVKYGFMPNHGQISIADEAENSVDWLASFE